MNVSFDVTWPMIKRIIHFVNEFIILIAACVLQIDLFVVMNMKFICEYFEIFHVVSDLIFLCLFIILSVRSTCSVVLKTIARRRSCSANFHHDIAVIYLLLNGLHGRGLL